jgi:predicted enzyme related to lactoylglutathione lyase
MAGQPSYLELGVPDAAAARAFIGALLGWQSEDGSRPAPRHRHPRLRPEAHFEVFFAVADLAASLRTLPELGGETVGQLMTSEG